MLRKELLTRLAPAFDRVQVETAHKGAIPSAVLIILHYHKESSNVPRVLLTKRSSNLRTHRSEISFPGGRLSAEDSGSLVRTALRETHEEIGLQFFESDVVGCLRPVNTMTSNHLIMPFVTVQQALAEHEIEPAEVEKVIDAPLIQTLSSMSVDQKHRSIAEDACQFVYDGEVIWGATARIMRQLHNALIRPS